MAVMPGPPQAEDCEDLLIRADYRNLESASWWRSTGARGVVLYAWGLAKYLPVARAIRTAGLKLVVNMDTSGLIGVASGPFSFWASRWRILNSPAPSISGWTRFFFEFLNSVSWSLLRNDWGRALHLRQADLVGAVTPKAAQRLQKLLWWYGGPTLAQKVALIPHPIADYMRYEGAPKRRRVIVVGRWLPEDWRQKNPFLLKAVAEKILTQNPDVEFFVFGRTDAAFSDLLGSLKKEVSSRFHIMGPVPNRELVTWYQSAQVSLCTSAHESFHIASAEALCCGCSVVGQSLPELPGLQWFGQSPHGRLARKGAEGLSAALGEELLAWRLGERRPEDIASLWGERLHASAVASEIILRIGQSMNAGQPGKAREKSSRMWSK